MTPFGLPVAPDVYIIAAVSFSLTRLEPRHLELEAFEVISLLIFCVLGKKLLCVEKKYFIDRNVPGESGLK